MRELLMNLFGENCCAQYCLELGFCEAGLEKIEMDLTKIKPDITSDEIRHLFRTLREYNYKIERIKNVLRARP